MKKLLAVFAALGVTAAAVGTASAITNNYQEDFDHDFVGLMVALDDNGDSSGVAQAH